MRNVKRQLGSTLCWPSIFPCKHKKRNKNNWKATSSSGFQLNYFVRLAANLWLNKIENLLSVSSDIKLGFRTRLHAPLSLFTNTLDATHGWFLKVRAKTGENNVELEIFNLNFEIEATARKATASQRESPDARKWSDGSVFGHELWSGQSRTLFEYRI